MTIRGVQSKLSREIIAYSDHPELEITFSSLTLKGVQFDLIVNYLRSRIQLLTNCKFNYAIVSKFNNGNVYIGQHFEKSNNEVLAILYFGPPRDYILTLCNGKKITIAVKNGTLLYFTEHFKCLHSMPKDDSVVDTAVTVTLRQE